MSRDSPAGWITLPLARIVDRGDSGFASGEKNIDGGVPHLRMNNIGLNGDLVLDLIRRVPRRLAKPQYELHPGDVLVCTTNSGVLVGKCALFNLPGRYTFSNHLTRLRPIPALVDGSFLRWNLWLHWKSGTFTDKCKHWVNQSTIPKDALLETEVTVPPLPEQHRIVARLESLLASVGSCRERLAKIPAILKRFRQSVLSAACSGKLTADWRGIGISDVTDQTQRTDTSLACTGDFLPSWRCLPLSEVLAEPLANGRSVPDATRGFPVLRLTCLKDGRVDLSQRKTGAWTLEMARRFCVAEGDFFVSRGNGSLALVGRGGLVESTPDGVAFPDTLIRVRARPDMLLPAFLRYVWNSRPVRDQIESAAHTTAGIWKVSQNDLEGVRLPIPCLPEQHEIVRRVDALFGVAQQIQARFERAKAQVERLTPSILAKAFRGELVPQDPNDEPA